MSFLKGDIFYCDLNNTIGCVQHGIRPVYIASNNFYNGFSDNVTIIPISSSMDRLGKTHVAVEGEDIEECGLRMDSKILCEQIMTVSKEQVKQRVGHASLKIKRKVNDAIKLQLAL